MCLNIFQLIILLFDLDVYVIKTFQIKSEFVLFQQLIEKKFGNQKIIKYLHRTFWIQTRAMLARVPHIYHF